MEPREYDDDIAEESENLGEDFGVPPNGPDDKAEQQKSDNALFAEEQQLKQEYNRD